MTVWPHMQEARPSPEGKMNFYDAPLARYDTAGDTTHEKTLYLN